jgi:hypothetical protein
MLPRRRKPLRSGIEREVRRVWPRHEQWVRGHECCVSNHECAGKIQFAHVRQGGNAGTGLKPPSWQGIALCAHHHLDVQHLIGHAEFDKRYAIDSLALAAEFARKSPDWQMREAMASASEMEVAS